MVLHKELYASVAFMAGGMYYAMMYFAVPETITTIVTLVVGFMVRIAAVQFGWRLPIFQFEEIGKVEPKELESKS